MNRCPPGVDSSFFPIPVLPCQRRQRQDPSRSFPVDLRCQHGSTRFTQVGLPFPVLQGAPRLFLTCQKPPERPPVHPGPSGIIPVHHGGTTVQPPVLPGSPRSMDRGEPGSTGSPVGLGHKDLNAIICHIICIVTIKLKWSNNATNTCVCDYIAWKVHINIITVW